jgi:hypothetical protein
MNGRRFLGRGTTTQTALGGHARPVAAKLAAAGLVLVAAALVLAGCGDGGGAGASQGEGAETTAAAGGGPAGSDVDRQLARFSQCMRDNGVPNFPDQRTVNGRIQLSLPPGMNPDSPQFQQAFQACRSLLPAQQGGAAAGTGQQDQLLKFVKCMRKNGVPNFPDPSKGGQTVVTGMDPSSPQFQSALQACQSLIPAGAIAGGG